MHCWLSMQVVLVTIGRLYVHWKFIKGTNGHSQGVVPFLKVVNDTAVAVNQGGKRKGAVCTYLNPTS